MRTLAIASVAVIAGACGGQSEDRVQAVPAHLLEPFEPSGLSASEGPVDPIFTVVRSATDWQTLWPTLRGRAMPVVDPPEVDFSRHAVVVAGLGRRPSGAFGLETLSSTGGGWEITVNVIETRAGPGCIAIDIPTTPIALALIPANVQIVRFNVGSAVKRCE